MSYDTTSFKQRGVVLVWVLWVGTLLGLIAASYAFGVRAGTVSVTNAGLRLQAETLAESSVNMAILELLEVDDTMRWRTNGEVRQKPFGGGELRYVVYAETGKVNLNMAQEKVIKGLGEEDLYAEMARRRTDRPQAFLSVNEPEVPDRVLSIVTVHSETGEVDPVVASRSVLLAIPGLGEKAVDMFLREREAQKKNDAMTHNEVAQEIAHLLEDGKEFLAILPTRHYTISAEGLTKDGVSAFVQAVVRITPDSTPAYRILSWRTGPEAIMPDSLQ